MNYKKVRHTTATSILRPLHRTICISWHLQLRIRGFYGSSYTAYACMLLLKTTSEFRLVVRYYSMTKQNKKMKQISTFQAVSL